MQQKVAEFLNTVFGFRKFLLMIAVYSIGVMFRIKGLIDGAEMVDLFKATTLSFFGANGVEHVVTCVKEYNSGNVTKALAAQSDGQVVPADEQEANDAKAEAGAQ